MRKWSVLYKSHHFGLHFSHAFLVLLTFLLLLLGGVTGPQTGYWWLSLTYAGLGSGVEVWNVGGLGSCRAGERCVQGGRPPSHTSTIEGCLRWHIAAGVLFLLSAVGAYLLCLFTPEGSMSIHWWTLFIPILVFLLPLITLIVDLCIRSSLNTAKEIEKVDTKASFWLVVLALITALMWLGVIQYVRWLSLKPVPKRRKKQVEAKGWDLASLWPWR